MPDTSKVLLTLEHLTRYDGKLKTWTEGVYKIVEQETADTGYFKTYKLQANGTDAASSVKINIPKDFVVKDAAVRTCETADTPVTGLVPGDKYIDLTVNTVDASTETGATHLYIAVKDLVSAYTSGNGIAIDANNAISVVTGDGLQINSTTKAVEVKTGVGVQINTTTKAIDVVPQTTGAGSPDVGGLTNTDYVAFRAGINSISASAGTPESTTTGNATVTTKTTTFSVTNIAGSSLSGIEVTSQDTTYGNATPTTESGGTTTPAAAGLMSGTDKDNLDALIAVLGNDVSIATDADIDALFD